MEKIFKTHRMGKAWEIDYYTFSIVWVLFSIRFSSCGILYHIGNAWVSWSISHSMEKLQQNSLYGDNLWNWCSYFSIVWVLFSIKFPSYGILHHMGNKWVPPSVSHSIRKCSEIHRVGRACIGNHTFPKVWVFFSIRFHPIAYFTIWEIHGFSHQFVIAWENAAKSTLRAIRLPFHSIIFSACSKIWSFLKRTNKKTLLK